MSVLMSQRSGRVSPAALVLLLVIVLAGVFIVRGCSGFSQTGNTATAPEGEFAVDRVSPTSKEVVTVYYMRRTGPGKFEYRVAGEDTWQKDLPAMLKDPASGKMFPAYVFRDPLHPGGEFGGGS